MKTSGIYRIDLGNGWFYIGSAQNLRKRECEHRRSLERKDHNNKKMQNIWNKHGIFEFVILEQCTEDVLLNCEQMYLDKHFDDLKNVNLTPTAGSILGYNHSIESRVKMSAAGKRRIHSVETRAKMSASRKGKVFSAETRAKISEANRRRVLSDETRAKISESGRVAWARKHAAKTLSI